MPCVTWSFFFFILYLIRTVRDDLMTEQVPSVHIWKAATCPLLMCLQRQHSITDGAASLTQRAWEWRSWVGSNCMRAFFQQLVFALTSFDGNSMTQSERNRGVKGKTLSIFALRWTNAQRMCQMFPILTHTTSERRSLDFEKRTKFTRQFKVAEMDETCSKLNWTQNHSAFTAS